MLTSRNLSWIVLDLSIPAQFADLFWLYHDISYIIAYPSCLAGKNGSESLLRLSCQPRVNGPVWMTHADFTMLFPPNNGAWLVVSTPLKNISQLG